MSRHRFPTKAEKRFHALVLLVIAWEFAMLAWITGAIPYGRV